MVDVIAVATIIFKEELVELFVALGLNFLLYYYHQKIKGIEHHYLLFNFFPSVIASLFPDTPYILFEVFRSGVFRGVKEVVYMATYNPFHWFFHNILTAWIIIPLVMGIIYLIVLLNSRYSRKKLKMPENWLIYVTIVCLTSLIVHIYIMDPLGF